jgi:mRNA interferase YafQ
MYTNQFKKDYQKLLVKKPTFEDLQELFEVIRNLRNNILLEKKYRDHQLVNDKEDRRDCHVKPDLVLLYKKDKENLILARIGSHSYLGI